MNAVEIKNQTIFLWIYKGRLAQKTFELSIRDSRKQIAEVEVRITGVIKIRISHIR